jgi:hypothetical protein
MLMPAAVLIVIVVGSIAVDFAIVFLGEREAAALAAAAANDAATAAVDEQVFRETGEYRLDEARARRVAEASLASSSSELDELAVEVVVMDIGGEPAVTVRIRGTVTYVFARAIPGAPDGARVEAVATAVARIG